MSSSSPRALRLSLGFYAMLRRIVIQNVGNWHRSALFRTSFSIRCSALDMVRPTSRFSPPMPGMKGNRVKVPTFQILKGRSMGLTRPESGYGPFLNYSFIRVNSHAVRFQVLPILVLVDLFLQNDSRARQQWSVRVAVPTGKNSWEATPLDPKPEQQTTRRLRYEFFPQVLCTHFFGFG